MATRNDVVVERDPTNEVAGGGAAEDDRESSTEKSVKKENPASLGSVVEKGPRNEGTGGGEAEDDRESSTKETARKENAAGLGNRMKNILSVDMLEIEMAARIARLEKEVAVLKLSKSKAR